MRQLSPEGQQVISDLASRHGVSVEATMSMLDSVINGNGQMAQFNHPEFAGSGQWMRGGMTMVSDMFNHSLSARVDALCNDLSNLVAGQPGLVRSGSFQSQNQSNGNAGGHYSDQSQFGGGQSQGMGSGVSSSFGAGLGSTAGAGFGAASLFVPPAPGMSAEWWPSELQWPSSTGAQNGVRYAYFPQVRRLAIDVGGTVTLYDTLDHQIGGFSQQQSVGGSLGFNSQYGLIDVASLPVVSVNGATSAPAIAPAAMSGGVPPADVATVVPAGATAQGVFAQGASAAVSVPTAAPAAGASTTGQARTSSPAAAAPISAVPASATAAAPAAGSQDIFVMLEKLAELRTKGILTEEEFTAKKIDLLSRL